MVVFMIRDIDGKITSEAHELLEVWTTYFEELLNRDNVEEENANNGIDRD